MYTDYEGEPDMATSAIDYGNGSVRKDGVAGIMQAAETYSKIGSGKTSDRTEGDYKDRRSCSMKDSHASKQTAFQKGFSTIDHIHAVSRLIEVSREYKMPLCLDFLDLEKAVDSIETERILELSDNQRVPTQYIKVDIIPSKMFAAGLGNAMPKVGMDNMGMKVDGNYIIFVSLMNSF
ncbi:hypothetical protein RB195_023554 [Necator americanus]|uniref:Uncharacterized protein n=1 Tax=Necator americanus TaxID=51031 RepID=A0ABR1EJR7_NECAM